jgi:hypothetical protein
VTEIELVGENVDVQTGVSVQIGVASALRRHVDAFIGNVSARDEKVADCPVLLFLRPEIHVSEGALGILEQVQIVWALKAIGD